MQNVVLVTIDSLRADHVGYHGYDRETTPNIDRIAAEGSRFMNAFAHVGGTRFSFPSILSGVTPLMHGGHRQISETQMLISEVFQEAGYRTGGFHSNLYVSGEFGYDRGWDKFYDSAPDKSVTARARRWVKTNLQYTPIYAILQRGYDYLESSQGINVGSYHVRAEEITDRALAFARDSPDEPTFLWVHYMDVHHPFLPEPEYQRLFRGEVVSDRDSVQLRRMFIEEPESVTDEERQTFVDLYDAEIRHNDEELGRLIDELRTLWDDEPLVTITADHGDHFLEHGYFGGARTLDVKTHVPLAVSGWADDGEYDDLVGLADVPTTLLDASDLRIPETYHGYSLQRLVFDGEWPREAVIGGWDNMQDERTIAIRTQDWKLVRRPDGTRELYDMHDGLEDTNVLDEQPYMVQRLEDALDDHLEMAAKTGDVRVARPNVGDDVKARLRRLGYDE